VNRWVYLIYPATFAAAAVMRIAAANGGQYRPSDLLVILTAAVAIAVVVTGLALLLARAVRADDVVERAAPIAALAVIWFVDFVPLQNALSQVSWRLSREVVLVPAGVLVSLVVVSWSLRQPAGRLRGLNRFGAIFGSLLLAFGVIGTIRGDAASSRVLAHSALARDLSRPVPAGPQSTANGPLRDIYLIILDGHANARARREVLGDSSTAFEDSLRALGFVIPPEATSNYIHTFLSLSSLLNFEQITQIANEVRVTSTDFALPKYLIENNRTARFLKARGYRYLLFPSAWFDATQFSPLADSVYVARATFNIREALRRTELRTVVAQTTLLHPLVRLPKMPDLGEFDALKDVPSDTAPTFAFAHVMLPHLPYVYDSACRPLRRPITSAEENDSPEQRAAYLAQVTCVDRMTLDAVRGILRRSPTPPIILVLADHGSRFTDVRFYEHPESVSRDFVKERFGAFAAAYVPAGGDSAFTQPITLVNVFRHVLSYYFGADLPPLPPEYYVSGARPYVFYPVPAAMISTVGPSPDPERGHGETVLKPHGAVVPVTAQRPAPPR
jgi:hypothetical protein